MSLIDLAFFQRYQSKLDTAIRNYVSLHSADRLQSLKDVNISEPTNGQVLKWNGSKWINGTGGGGGSSSDISDMDDVSLENLQDGQALVWDSLTEKWKNRTVSGGGGSDDAIYLTGILPSGTSSIVLASSDIQSDSIIDVYTSEIGVDYTNIIVVPQTSITVYFDSQPVAVSIIVVIRNR